MKREVLTFTLRMKLEKGLCVVSHVGERGLRKRRFIIASVCWQFSSKIPRGDSQWGM